MSNQEIIEKTRAFVEQKFTADGSGHDYWHMHRVWKLAGHIADNEPTADRFVVELAALLHDLTDTKLTSGDTSLGEQQIIAWLESIAVNKTTILSVLHAIQDTSFSSTIGASNSSAGLSKIEAKIISDADKLDAIGAIGIARAFAYGGSKNRKIHDPARQTDTYKDAQAYHENDTPTINHFYEKLLLLKDRMHTETGKQMALARHKYMEQFLAEFYAEWDGKH